MLEDKKNLTVTFSTSVSYTLVKPMAKPNRNKRRKEAKQKECFIVLLCKRTWRRTIMFRSEMDTSHQDAHNGDQTLMPKLLWIFNTLWFWKYRIQLCMAVAVKLDIMILSLAGCKTYPENQNKGVYGLYRPSISAFQHLFDFMLRYWSLSVKIH